MPQKSEIDSFTLLEKLKNYPDIFDEFGNLKNGSEEVWMSIKIALKLKMAPQSIYIRLYHDRDMLLTNLKEHFGINSSKKFKELKLSDDYSPRYLSNPNNCTQISFRMSIPKNKILVEEKKKSDDWTDVLSDELWEIQKLPCAFSFKDGYATKNYFKFLGICHECKTNISGTSENIDGEELVFNVTAFATHGIQHKKRRQLKNKKRRIAKKILQYKPVDNYCADEIAKVTTKFTPPNIFDNHVIQKAREEAIDDMIGWTSFKGKSFSMRNEKFIRFANIRKGLLKPITIVYFSDDQIKVWNYLVKLKLPTSFDATAGVVKRYQHKDGSKSKTIFYYVLVVGFAGKIIPIFQALLSAHYVAAIKIIFDIFFEKGGKKPKEIATDGSTAIKNAVNLAINGMTDKQYNNACLQHLINANIVLPVCYCRHDVAHIVKNITDWESLKRMDTNISCFFVRSVGYLIKTLDLQELIHVATSIIIVAKSNVMERGSNCEKHKQILDNLLMTYEYNSKIFSDLSSNIGPLDLTGGKNDGMVSCKLFIDELFDKVSTYADFTEEISDEINLFYCPGFIEDFQRICYSFPSWTNVMMTSFRSPNPIGSSARSECYYKNVKIDQNTLSLPKFILFDKKRYEAGTKYAELKIFESNFGKNENASSIEELENSLVSDNTLNETSKQLSSITETVKELIKKQADCEIKHEESVTKLKHNEDHTYAKSVMAPKRSIAKSAEKICAGNIFCVFCLYFLNITNF